MTGRPHITHSAIPGQPTHYHTAASCEVERAIQALYGLSRALGRRDIFACARPDPISVTWWEATGELSTVIDDYEAWHIIASRCRSIRWRWGCLRDYSDGWYDLGWHPDHVYHGLSPAWRHLLDGALARRP